MDPYQAPGAAPAVPEKKKKKAGCLLILLGSLVVAVPFIGIFAAIAIPSFLKFQSRSKQVEAKMNLKQLMTAQESRRLELGNYAQDLSQLDGVQLHAKYYTYFLGKDVKKGSQSSVGALPPGLPLPNVAPEGFRAVAVGNLDGDDTLDVWVVDQRGQFEHLMDDTRN